MARKRRETEMDDVQASGKEHPIQRNAANARERARMRVLSKAFSKLKTSLPWVPVDTKLSKLDTLRLASSYISHLKRILTEDEPPQQMSFHPVNLTWPFTFQSRSPSSSEQTQPNPSTSSRHHIEPISCEHDGNDVMAGYGSYQDATYEYITMPY